MLNKDRVQAEIAQITEQYANGLYTKIEALEAMRDAVDCEINNWFIENKSITTAVYPDDASDYFKAETLLIQLKTAEKFKNSISFGDILQHRPL